MSAYKQLFINYGNQASAYADSFGIPSSNEHNDARDAFRHAYTSAVLTRDFGSLAAHAMGNLHEFEGYYYKDAPPSETNMDLWNNQFGRSLDSSNLSNDQIAELIMNAIRCGDLITDPKTDPRKAPFLDLLLSRPNPGSVLIDPLVLDLNGDGVALTNSLTSTAFFDMDGDGIREKTGWASGGDGFLVRDINNNGSVDNINEMIGTSTQDAFTFLRTLDDNKDGKITAADATWKTLKVWVDADGDGVTDTGELKTLAELGITEFNLSDKALGTKNEGNNIYSQVIFQTLSSCQKINNLYQLYDKNGI